MANDKSQAPTLQTTPAFRAAGSQRRVLVCGDRSVTTHPLPESGDVLIGRADDADVRVDDPSVSRRHAVVHVGPTLRIEDLGSANGTRVRGELLRSRQVVEIEPNDPIDLGSVMLIVQSGTAARRPRRLCNHGYFEVRLEEECARAERSGRSFAVARLHVEGSGAAETTEQALDGDLGATDVVAAYGPGEYEALLLEAPAEVAPALLAALTARLAERGVTVRTGVAVHPRDGRSPETLLAHACAAVRGDASRPPPARPTAESEPMQRLRRLVGRVAEGTIAVLIVGETGVGKEVVAAEIHRRSRRSSKPFVPFNCAAFAETLLESELFGHERGAFTGAFQTKIGLLEAAHGGTVLLDEVGELPLSTQAKLLRVLETHEVLRVGSVKPRPLDVRFVAATNRDLEAEIRRGRFREDLYFRLDGVTMTVPPLRERVSEIEPLATAFVAEASAQLGRGDAPRITTAARALLQRYGWPGNVRELRNVMERAVLLCTGGAIDLEHLPVDKLGATMVRQPGRSAEPSDARPASPVSAGTPRTSVSAGTPRTPRLALADVADDEPLLEGEPTMSVRSLRTAVETLEKEQIIRALAECGGNQSRAASLLAMPRRTLVARIAQYGIPRPRGPRRRKGA